MGRACFVLRQAGWFCVTSAHFRKFVLRLHQALRSMLRIISSRAVTNPSTGPSCRAGFWRSDSEEMGTPMTLRARMTSRVPAFAAVLFFMLASAACAQDVMQLDLDFKNSLTRGGPSTGRDEPALGQRNRLRDAQDRSVDRKRGSPRHLDVKR